jgi:hypothetical protein
MDFNVNLNINIGFSEESLNVLRQFAPDLPAEMCNCTAHQGDLKTFIKETVNDYLRDLQAYAKKPVEEAKPETEHSPVQEAKAAPAPQKGPAAAPEKEITDADLRQAVKAAKDKVGTPVVKALFAEFEIPNSSACPQERRGELMDRLEKLAA